MPTHNCETCKKRGRCPIESIAPWLNEHEEESVSAGNDCAYSIATACTELVIACPSMLLESEAVTITAQICFLIGYQKGRTYQDVPQVFKDSL